MFPHLEDYFSDPNVIYGVRFGNEFTVRAFMKSS